MGGRPRDRSDCYARRNQRNQLRFCYYKDGEFVNRPLTVSPAQETAERTGEVVETMASPARILSADEIEGLIKELGEQKILPLSVIIGGLGKSRLSEVLKEGIG